MENLGICLDGFTALRAEAKSSSEMISSLVFGEQYKIIEEKGEWLKIINRSDGYEAWMSLSNHNPLNKEVALEVCSFVGTMRKVDTNETIHISPGCYVTSFEGDFTLNNVDFQWIEHSLDVPTELKGISAQFLGTPYIWGGRSIYGIDCSGLTQMVYRAFGLEIPRDSRPQSTISENQLTFKELEPGDLAFFINDDNQVNHVGLVLNNSKIIHASGTVHIDELKPDGIYNKRSQRTHLFAWGIKKPLVK